VFWITLSIAALNLLTYHLSGFRFCLVAAALGLGLAFMDMMGMVEDPTDTEKKDDK
jgi:NO-binding membrane sensor protein with MHYT domain